MNIFELIANDSTGQFTSYMGMNHGLRNWVQFRQLTDKIMESSDPTNLIEKSKYLWIDILKNSPEIARMSQDYYIFVLGDHLEKNIQNKISLAKNIHEKLLTISKISSKHRQYIEIFQNQNIRRKYKEIIAGIMENINIKAAFSSLFELSFRLHCKIIIDKQMIDFEESVRSHLVEKCSGAKGMLEYGKLKQCLDYLSTVGLVEEYLESNFSMLNSDLNNFIEECVDLSQNKQFHRKCLNYQRTFQKTFLNNIISPETERDLSPFISSMDDNTYTLCAKHCSNQILDIILDFPESYPTIISLRQCLNRTQYLSEVTEKLVHAVEKRLLIPGVLTQNILNQYINILKVLQIIDPHGFIFDKITLPIKNYLLKRNDTLRCIISFLTDDANDYSKLTQEVVKIPSMEHIDERSSDEDENVAEQWQVLPVRESKTKIRIKYQESDLVSVLVNLYGSQEAFINEYQNMLAEKLMSAREYNIEDEITNIERLKMRFGEAALQTCNIIVKDVKDSKRLDRQIHHQRSHLRNAPLTLQQMNCLAVSKGYWPINYETSSTQIPPAFKDVFDEYASMYSRKKAMRKIHFHYNLGHVNITLTFKNGSFDFKCMPVHAMMISYFDEEELKNRQMGISSEELSSWLYISHNSVKQKMSFWVHKGVLSETRVPKQGLSLRRINSFEDGEVIYYKPVIHYQNVASDEIDEDIDDMIIKEGTSMESHLKHIIEGLIISILNINGPKSAEKIHLLLKTIYKTDLDYTYGQAQTLEILKKMTQKKKIQFNGETYSTKATG